MRARSADVVLGGVAFQNLVLEELHEIARREHVAVVEEARRGMPLPIGKEPAHPLPHIPRDNGVQGSVEELEMARVDVVVVDVDVLRLGVGSRFKIQDSR